ncbi:MAG: RsmE family RNA methyltransferase [Candidatus Ornithospirochaeta sp.]
MRVFLLDKEYDSGSIYTLRKREVQYLTKVLRLETGTVFTAKDKDENYYRATLIDPKTLSLEPTENPEETLMDSLSSYCGPFAPIDVYVSLLKGKKNEGVVRALTEIGVRRIVLVDSQNVQEHTLSPHQKERLETILKEAVQQCGGKAPVLIGPVSFNEAVQSAEGTKVILHQSTRGKTTTLSKIFSSGDVKIVASLFIGPEGGFSDEECDLAENHGAEPVLLRTNILRAETASVYAASVVQSLLHR